MIVMSPWGVGSGLNYEGRVLMNGITALTKEVQKSSLFLLVYEDTVRKHQLYIREQALPRYQVRQHFDLRYPVSRTVINKFLLFINC
jgi:hypothetical protein